MELKTQNLKELYEKDFYLWVMENLKLLKNGEYDNARSEIKKLFKDTPSLRQKAEQKESLEKAWQYAVINLIGWFEKAEDLAKKYFGRLPTEEDFPQTCPYTFEQVMEHRPWMKES